MHKIQPTQRNTSKHTITILLLAFHNILHNVIPTPFSPSSLLSTHPLPISLHPLMWFGHGALETQHPIHPFPSPLLYPLLCITLYINLQLSFTHVHFNPTISDLGQPINNIPFINHLVKDKHYLGSPNGSLHLGSFFFFSIFTHALSPSLP